MVQLDVTRSIGLASTSDQDVLRALGISGGVYYCWTNYALYYNSAGPRSPVPLIGPLDVVIYEETEFPPGRVNSFIYIFRNDVLIMKTRIDDFRISSAPATSSGADRDGNGSRPQ